MITAKNLIEILEAAAHNTGKSLDEIEIVIDTGWGITSCKDYSVDCYSTFSEELQEFIDTEDWYVSLETYER